MVLKRGHIQSFLDPKLHPDGSCMICCNANQSKINKKNSSIRKVIKNFDKCLKHYVEHHVYSEDQLSSLSTLVGEHIAIINDKKKIIEIKVVNSKGEYENVSKFTSLKLDFVAE